MSAIASPSRNSNRPPAGAAPFEHIVFDLDDTLLDTFRQLLPRASREACAAMIEAGLQTRVESCVAAWNEHTKSRVRRDLFGHLVSRFGIATGADAREVALRGHHAFYSRSVEKDISLFPGAREMLIELGKTYSLHLVTSGIRATQEEKIRILELGDLFESISHVDPDQGQCKRDAFAGILKRTGASAEKHLSVGNRIDTDVAEARVLGFKACWVRYGEYAALEPASADETPDFMIDSILELPNKCRL